MPEPDENIDEELANLIDSLDTPTSDPAELPEQPEPNEVPEQAELPEIVEKPIEIPKPVLKAKAVIKPSVPPSVNPPTKPDPASAANSLEKLTVKYHTIFDKLVQNLDSDRERFEEFINIYALQVQTTAPKQSFVEGLVQLLSAKAKVSADGVKLLDTAAKMLAASKSIALGDKGVKAPKEELERLMSTHFDEEAP